MYGYLWFARRTIDLRHVADRLLLFLLFFPHATPFAPPKPPHISSLPSYRTALLVAIICVIHALVTLVISTLILYLSPPHLQAWANILGVTATLLAGVQFIPQLFTTWRLQAVGSLSIPTMCIQTPGSFVFAGSLAKRLGSSGWSTWGIYLITGCLQGGLLGMSIFFEVRERRRRKRAVSAIADGRGEQNVRAEDNDEQTALLGNIR